MVVASLLVDGTLFNVELGARLLVSTTPHAVHHCVFWSTFRARLRIEHTAFFLVAEPSAPPACGSFSLPDYLPGNFFVVRIEPDAGPLSFTEMALANTIAGMASADVDTPHCTARNKAVHTSDTAHDLRARKCTKALSMWCPRLAAFRENNEQVCVVRKPRKRPPQSDATAFALQSTLGNTEKHQPQPGAAAYPDSSIHALFLASGTMSREWRKCVVSFSTIMRFFQREKTIFKWAAPGHSEQTVISLKEAKTEL